MTSFTDMRIESGASYARAANRSIHVGRNTLAYRDLGPRDGVPVVLLNHWGAVLDNFDPRIVDGLASRHRVIATDYRGIGASGGTAPITIDEMARDTIALNRTLGFEQVNLLGFSLGGFVAQDVVLKAPNLVRKLILTGTGPAGGAGIDQVGTVSWPFVLKGLLTLRDPKYYLFFTSTAKWPPGRERLPEAVEGTQNRSRYRPHAQCTPAPVAGRGRQPSQDLGRIRVPVLIANGDNDIMVPTANSRYMASRIPDAQLVIYEDAGHGGIFQHHADFVTKALAFLDE